MRGYRFQEDAACLLDLEGRGRLLVAGPSHLTRARARGVSLPYDSAISAVENPVKMPGHHAALSEGQLEKGVQDVPLLLVQFCGVQLMRICEIPQARSRLPLG